MASRETRSDLKPLQKRRCPCCKLVSDEVRRVVEADPARWIAPFMQRLTEPERATLNLIIRVAVNGAAAAEREACAQICDTQSKTLLSFGHRLTAEILAQQIRQRAASPSASEAP